MVDKIKVLAWPAKINRSSNPYNYILYTNIERQNVEVVEFTFRLLLDIRKYDIFHFHWPENIFLVKSSLRAYRNLFFFCFILIFLKLFKKKIVWTVHNYSPHENNFKMANQILQAFLYRFTDGFISLSYAGSQYIKNNISGSKKVAVIPHPHYRNYYNNDKNKEECREILAIPSTKFVFVFLGQIRKYKNITGLIDSFTKIGADDNLLIIAGKIHPEMSNIIQNEVNQSKNILLIPDFVDDDMLQVYIKASDISVIPYKSVLNSGSVFLNLSFSVPTLLPKTAVFSELQEIVGEDFLKTYSVDLTAKILEDSKNDLILSLKNRRKVADLTKFDPDLIASDTIKFYRNILEN